MKYISWKTYTFEFLSIFIAVIAAFALNNWNDNRRDRNAEVKILKEIKNGLQKDIVDIEMNVEGHKQGISACKFWVQLINEQQAAQDSLPYKYLNLTRDFISIQNQSGYESLKSKGLELIRDDSLRFGIISLYEYDVNTIEKLEESYSEMQFQESYFNDFNRIASPLITLDASGNITGIELPLKLSNADRKLLLSYLWKIRVNRRFIMQQYTAIEEKIKVVNEQIDCYLMP